MEAGSREWRVMGRGPGGVTVTSLQAESRGWLESDTGPRTCLPPPQGPQPHCGHADRGNGSQAGRRNRAAHPSLPGATARLCRLSLHSLSAPSPFGLLAPEVKDPQKTNIQPIFET